MEELVTEQGPGTTVTGPRVWRRGMMTLGYTLMAEAGEAGFDKWVSYQLKDSPVLVSCRMPKGGTCDMRIARPDKEYGDQWQRELAAMAKFLGCMGWKERMDAKAKGFAVIFTAP